MKTKKAAPASLPRTALVQQKCTSRKGKDSEKGRYFQEQQGEMPTPQHIHHQRQKIAASLAEPTEQGKTRMQIAVETGIERANVCRRVAELRKEGRIYSCGRHLCKITKAMAEYLTCDQHTAFEYYLRRTEVVWAALPTENERHAMQDAICQYAIEGKTDIDIFGLTASAVREMWDEAKEIINKEVKR